ncbi:BamA/TamA family outer membrane protein [Rubrivirga sp.]|uniref:BamA/TamA family outer membrane protein n=1 Tax=Rubrivirga sp. TaxID=1885344 RepID=UPI003B52E151
MRRFSVLLAAVLVAGCATTATYVAPEIRADPVPPLPEGEVAHRVFLTGNTGDLADGGSDAVLRALAADARTAGPDATVAVLGNVTADGVPAEGDPDRAQAEAPVRALIAALDGIEADVVVVPGNRDWERGEDGVQRLEDLLDDAFGDDVLTPGDQAGGPREWEPAEGLRLIALDTAWWLLDADERPAGEAEDQDVRTPGDVARIFEQIVVDRDDSRIVVLAHHPILSRGPSAGYRSNPLAGLASRTLGLSGQDLASPRYRALRGALGRVAETHDGLVWAASHDRILQTYERVVNPLRSQTHLVSGTGGGEADPAGGAGARYVSSRPGYQRLVYFANGRLWTETVELDDAGTPQVVFRAEISGANPELVDTEVPDAVDPDDLPPLDRTVTLAADEDFVTDRFQNDAFTRALFGENYRDVWKTPVEFRTIDLGTEAGGLVPVKRGGGLQTTSLRLQAGDGHEYGLRLLEKSGLAQVPTELRDGLVGDVVLELRAAMNPYAALVAAPLATAAGVPQPDPEIVFVPDDPRLGRYRETFANRLALFEIRPDDDMSDVPGFEGMTDVISASKLREEMREDHDHRVDQRAYLRARLFDMLLADWDRHADQWRWAAFEPGELDPSLTGDAATRGKVYRPIARDRDFSFYGINGLLQPALQAFDRRLQPIGEKYGNVRGLTTNGFYQDRPFLNELTLDDWRAVARELQAALTDDAIERAVRALPGPIYPQLADYWTPALKTRRDKLVQAAEDYYELTAKVVDVIGSDEREQFEVVRQADGSTEVTVRSFKGGEPGRLLYQRTVRPGETDEVRLYGLAGRDEFRVTGDGPREIPVRVIGGAGDDELVASAGDVAVYDTPDGLEIVETGRKVEDRRSADPDVNRYDPTEHVLGKKDTFPTLGYRSTDGVLLGATRIWSVPGFRLRPYAATHEITVNYATATGGFAGGYTGRMREAVGTWDLDVDAYASTPRYARNFYGLGNGSPNIDPELAEIDLARVQARAGLGIPIGESLKLVIGPSGRYADPGRDSLQLASSPVGRLPATALEGQTHLGGFARLAASTVHNAVNPQQGLRFAVESTVLAGVSGPSETYGVVGGEAAAYLPLSLAPQLTVAVRAGAEHIVGDFPFFDAVVLGGPGTVRGYRRERFAGRTAASGSAELRAKLFDLNAYVLPLNVGVLGFVDAGRVWADFPSCAEVFGDAECMRLADDGVAVDYDDPFASDEVQLGYGGGLWIGVLDRAVVNLTVGASDENALVTFGLGFAY